MNVLIGIDQTFNAVGGGDPDETVSSRIGKMKRKYGGTIPWRRPIVKIVEQMLNFLDKDHSIKAIEEDEGKDAVRRVK